MTRTRDEGMATVRGRRCCVAVGVALAVVLLAGCSSGSSGGTGPTVQTTPGGGDVSVDSTAGSPGAGLPQGWTSGTAEGLTFGVPQGFTGAAAGQGLAEAAVTYRAAATEGAAPPPVLGAFVEHGAVGPLGVRTKLLSQVRSSQLGAQPVDEGHAVTIPGASGAAALEWRWSLKVAGSDVPVPARQIEVVIATSGATQYGIVLGGPQTYMSDEVVAGFLGSLKVDPDATAQPGSGSATATS